MDEAGTPFCVTVDFETLDDDTVTLRHRDSTEQVKYRTCSSTCSYTLCCLCVTLYQVQ
jgi:glycyl-tRNA synthetase (class II)